MRTAEEYVELADAELDAAKEPGTVSGTTWAQTGFHLQRAQVFATLAVAAATGEVPLTMLAIRRGEVR